MKIKVKVVVKPKFEVCKRCNGEHQDKKTGKCYCIMMGAW
jgi:hypothetical protein